MRTLAFALLLAGCGGGGADELDGSVPDLSASADLASPPLCLDTEVGDAGLPATFTNVQRVFDQACIGCHCCGDPLTLTAPSYAQLVNVAAPNSARDTNESCGGVLVKPGAPSASYLYQKISSATPCAGQPMPLQEFQFVPLPACEQDLVRRWILANAPND
jgi:hypothetical protein